MINVIFNDIGLIDFNEAWKLQEKLFSDLIAYKTTKNCAGEIPANYVLFCEHPNVYTLGKSGSEKNLLISRQQMEQKNAKLYRINRGGDITFHGPGQLLVYPIINLELFGLGIKQYVHHLEESIILTLADFGIQAGRLQGATGVWMDATTPHARKIAAMGVRSSRYVTMHGFALNVNTDLSFFNHINPCGFTDKSVTSVSKEKEMVIDIEGVKKQLKQNMASVFGMNFIPDYDFRV
ncbi:MAG: lipoyl(octanoyl) transferase LipB [Bacteroidota bacterium]